MPQIMKKVYLLITLISFSVFSQKKFDNITHHLQLNQFSRMTPASYVMEDSKQRLWISFARKGVVMWDKKTGLTKQYTSGSDKKKNIGGNAIIDIKEDKYF